MVPKAYGWLVYHSFCDFSPLSRLLFTGTLFFGPKASSSSSLFHIYEAKLAPQAIIIVAFGVCDVVSPSHPYDKGKHKQDKTKQTAEIIPPLFFGIKDKQEREKNYKINGED